ncbi:unnamed protein product, partial [Polarella glacialis]
ATKAKSSEENQRLAERLRLTADTEMELRRELQISHQGHLDLQERVAELTGQLERAEAAYSEAAREVGSMSLRLNDLEFKNDSGPEDLLRQELTIAKERCNDLDAHLKECTWMRDYALQQAEEARLQVQKAEEARALQAESPKAARPPEAAAAGQAASEETEMALTSAREEVAAMREQLEKLIAQHSADFQQQADLFREEMSYLKRKNDEKDRRLEILTCERNALRFDSNEASLGGGSKPSRERPSGGTRDATLGDKAKEHLVDLEELSMKEVLSAPGQGSAAGTLKAFLADGDVILRRFSKLLFQSPMTRRIFYGYILLMHIWIWVVLHRAAEVHAAHAAHTPLTAAKGVQNNLSLAAQLQLIATTLAPLADASKAEILT